MEQPTLSAFLPAAVADEGSPFTQGKWHGADDSREEGELGHEQHEADCMVRRQPLLREMDELE
jgi:hypothetical protein